MYKSVYMEEIEKLIGREMEDFEQYKLDKELEYMRNLVMCVVRGQTREFVDRHGIK